MQDPEKPDNGLGLDFPREAEPTSSAETTPSATMAPTFAPTGPAHTGTIDEATRKAVDNVLYSDVGIPVFLGEQC